MSIARSALSSFDPVQGVSSNRDMNETSNFALNSTCLLEGDIAPYDVLYKQSLERVVEYYAGEAPEISQSNVAEAKVQVVSIVGFGGATIRGSSVLAASRSAIETLAENAQIDVLDCLGELNNQVTGRFKNSLLRHGVSTHTGIPITINSDQLDLHSSGAVPTVWQLSWSGGSLSGMIVIDYAGWIRLQIHNEVDVASEGTTILF